MATGANSSDTVSAPAAAHGVEPCSRAVTTRPHSHPVTAP